MSSVNIKNPAIKRIHADVRELMKDPSDQYHAAPLENNLFEWHFTLRGPPDTAFEGGVYHGRILLPPEYPFKPPDIVFTTPNGRFAVGIKICLTISSYHPEYWQPAWGIRLILEALISFFPSPSMGALGGLDWSDAERKRLAIESNDWKCYKCGLIRDLLPELKSQNSTGDGDGSSSSGGKAGSGGGASNRYAEQIRELHKLKVKTADDIAAESGAKSSDSGGREDGGSGSSGGASSSDGVSSQSTGKPNGSNGGGETSSGSRTATREQETGTAEETPADADVIVQDLQSLSTQNASSDTAASAAAASVAPDPRVADDDVRRTEGGSGARNGSSNNSSSSSSSSSRRIQDSEAAKREREREDDMLTYLAVAIAIAIAGILLRNFMRQLTA